MSLWSIIVPEATQNLVTNPSIEDAATGYTAVGAVIARDATQQRRGVYSLKVTPTAGVNDGAYYAITLQATKQYAFSVDGFWANGVPYKIYIYDVTAGVTLGSALQFIGAGKWERKMVVATTGANTSCRLYVTKDNSADTTIFYLDGWQCEQKGYATTYVDGDQGGCTWDGTAHASTSTRSSQWRLGGREMDFETVAPGVTVALPYSGIGMPPLSNLKQDRALLPGAIYRETKINERVITLTFTARGSSLANLHLLRKQLIDAIKPDRVTPKQPFLLRYGGAGVSVEIPCVYDSGLELGNLFGNSETMTMRCIAYDEPLWKEDGEKGIAISASQNLTVGGIVARIAGTWQAFNGGVTSPSYLNALAIGPDGSVYVTGSFTIIGGVSANRIARWNGAAWQALGTGLDNYGQVIAIAPNGDVYVGGNFATAGGVTCNNVARWNGSSWFALGATPGTNSIVQSLAFDAAGNLYVGGAFTLAGGVANTARIAKWDGTNWSALSTGATSGSVYTLAVALDGTVYAGGNFVSIGGVTTTGIAKWNGSAWSALAGGANSDVRDLKFDAAGALYAIGGFTTIGGLAINHIAKWNGSAWSGLGTGLSDTGQALAIMDDGTLYAGGFFTSAGGVPIADKIARWNTTVWSALDIDLPGSPTFYDADVHGGDLYITFDTGGTAVIANAYSILGGIVAANPSTAVTYPILKIKRSNGTSATLTHWRNETTGKTLYFNYPLADGEIVTIDLRLGKKSIISSVFGNMLSKLLPNSDLASWALAPGDNLITVYVVPAGGPTIDVRMRWRVQHWAADGAAV